MADLELADFDTLPAWTEADEVRPDVRAPEVPFQLSERGKRVLKANAKLRGVWDESTNGFPSDSERAYSVAYHAGYAGLPIEDAAWLLSELYNRPGKKKLHRSKLQKTLRAWEKGREEAGRRAANAPSAPPADTHARADQAPAKPKAPEREDTKTYEVLPAREFASASFAGGIRLVPIIGLVEGGVGLVTGAGGDGKSLFTMNLCAGWTGVVLPIAEAIVPARALRVLLMYVEDLPGMVQERYRKVLGSAPHPEGLCFFTRKEPIQFSGARGKPNDYALERLRATLRKHGPFDVIVFDPLCYLHQAEENSSSEMMRWLVPLREVCREQGAALIIVHHAGWAADGEDARGRGSTAIRAWADFELALRAQNKGGRVLHRLNLVKCNFAQRWTDALTLELDSDSLRFRVVDEAVTLCPTDALVKWMEEEHNGIWTATRADLYAAMQKRFGCSERTARDALAQAKQDGRLSDEGQRTPLKVVANSSERLL